MIRSSWSAADSIATYSSVAEAVEAAIMNRGGGLVAPMARSVGD
jgi:hypothetical protein